MPTMAICDGLEEKCCAMDGWNMEKSVLSTFSRALLMSRSEHMGPRRAVFWVVTYTGMLRILAALRSFWVVVSLRKSAVSFLPEQTTQTNTLSYSWMTGRNFSWMSHILSHRKFCAGLLGECKEISYNSAGLSGRHQLIDFTI